VNALLFRSKGFAPWRWTPIIRRISKQLTIGRDYGTTLEVLQGLDANDWIVLNPQTRSRRQEVRVKETP